MEEKNLVPVQEPEKAAELIVVSQLPVIEEQLIRIKSRVDETVAEVLALEVTEDTVTTIKKKRAELNKIATEFEDRRKEVKKAVLAPYEKFEATYKECVIDAFKTADAELKTRIAVVEDGVKNRKQEEVVAYFIEYAESLNLDFVTYDDMKVKVTMSDSVKKLKEQVKATLDKISADITMIATMPDADEIMAEYKRHYDAALAVTTVSNRHKAIEEEKRRAEERRKAEEARAEAERRAREVLEAQKKAEAEAMPQNASTSPVESVSAPVAQKPTEDGNGGEMKFTEPVEQFSATFTVYGSIEELKSIKNYLKERGIRYECE